MQGNRQFAKSTSKLIEIQDNCLRQMSPIGLMENSGQKINIEMAKWGPQGQNTALLSCSCVRLNICHVTKGLLRLALVDTDQWD